jgi:hypothetical protein
MTDDKNALYHRELSSKKGVEEDSDDEKYKGEKSTMPPLKAIGFDVEHKQPLNKSSCKKGTTSDASLPSNGAEPSFTKVSKRKQADVARKTKKAYQ